jgi:hypothetical protein
MNTESTAIVALILVLILVFLAFVFFGNHNVKPETVSGTTPEQSAPNEVKPEEVEQSPVKSAFDNRTIDDLIQITSPVSGQSITSPLVIEGKARGFWYFEAVFPVMLADSRNNIIARGLATAKSDWMTEDFVPFSTKLEFTPDYGNSGTLIVHNNNPSNNTENNREKRIPVFFAQKETILVQVYFVNTKLDPNFMGEKVFPVQRSIPKTQAVARSALEELLKGPTQQEQGAGYSTSINSDVKIQKLSIVDGTARVDFDSQLEFQVGGSARVGAIRAQITQTLEQFKTVQNVIISIDGRTEEILQP